MREVLRDIERWVEAKETICLATVVKTFGSSPRPVGSRMAVTASQQFAGSVSNGCVEGDVVRLAQEVLACGQPRLVNYGVTDELAFSVGLSCGGEIAIWLEPLDWSDDPQSHRRLAQAIERQQAAVMVTKISGSALGERWIWWPKHHEGQDTRPQSGPGPSEETIAGALEAEQSQVVADGADQYFLDVQPRPAHLIVVGASHIAVALAPLAKALGYRLTLIDPRSAFCTAERFPDADELIVAWPDDGLGRLQIDRSAYIVILTHDPKFDHPALVTSLRSPARYIGIIGSRRTNEARFQRLREEGLSEVEIARIHAPIGLDIGATTAEETALAILAQVTAVRRGRSGGSLAGQPQASVLNQAI